MDFNFRNGFPKGIDDNPVSTIIISNSVFNFVKDLAKEMSNDDTYPPYNQENAFNVMTFRINALHALFRLTNEETALNALSESVNKGENINMIFHDQTVVLTGDEVRKALGNSKYIAKSMGDLFNRRVISADVPEGGYAKMQESIRAIDVLANSIGIQTPMPTSLIANLTQSVMSRFPGPPGPRGGGSRISAA